MDSPLSLAELNMQMKHLVSELESEKGTMKRVHQDFFKEIRDVKATLYGHDDKTGVIGAMNILSNRVGWLERIAYTLGGMVSIPIMDFVARRLS